MTLSPLGPIALSDREILNLRSAKNAVDPNVPYAFLSEPELSSAGVVEPVNTIFLTNRECPFRCLMCDLWKNTLDEPTPPGAIPAQIDYALERLPEARVVKLYNSGNFFDAKAIPPSDYAEIARRLDRFDTVIVENHPKLTGESCLRFHDQIRGELEVAMGLETVDENVLRTLNKQMTLDDFASAAGLLRGNGIAMRSFMLVRPPGHSEEEGVVWAVRSAAYAFDQGVRCCAIVPTRAGNGAMEALASKGAFAPPRFASIEQTLEQALALQQGRVFMDLWDVAAFSDCDVCTDARVARLDTMNRTQVRAPKIHCEACNCQGDAS